VVVPAALRHRRANAIQFDVLKRVAPFALVFILVGVWLSNLAIFDGPEGVIWLGRVLAIFTVYIIVVNVRRLFEPRLEISGERTVTYPRGSAVGVAVGVQAGLMGVGGGALAVPLQQVLMHLPLRNCIANSTMLICITAGFGAIYKNATLAGHGLDWRISVSIALMLAPTAMLGGYFGGKLTHRLPLGWVRVLFIGLMCAAAWKMAAI
ncbi:MAG: sulfite exporter TauE/SafE family protein, partial [Desulfobacterales bacterium]|nr:sulfite exporter TauE/SafE family protein [Desulfobacterales bacterium]